MSNISISPFIKPVLIKKDNLSPELLILVSVQPSTGCLAEKATEIYQQLRNIGINNELLDNAERTYLRTINVYSDSSEEKDESDSQEMNDYQNWIDAHYALFTFYGGIQNVIYID